MWALECAIYLRWFLSWLEATSFHPGSSSECNCLLYTALLYTISLTFKCSEQWNPVHSRTLGPAPAAAFFQQPQPASLPLAPSCWAPISHVSWGHFLPSQYIWSVMGTVSAPERNRHDQLPLCEILIVNSPSHSWIPVLYWFWAVSIGVGVTVQGEQLQPYFYTYGERAPDATVLVGDKQW